MEQEHHWVTKCKFFISDFVDDLERDLNNFFERKFIISCPIFEPNNIHKNWIAIVYFKEAPIPKEETVNEILNIKSTTPNLKKAVEHVNLANEYFHKQDDKPTEKQLSFLKKNRFKIEPNLTKAQATEKIREYLERRNNESPVKSDKFVDY